jgi:hypothetical protein
VGVRLQNSVEILLFNSFYSSPLMLLSPLGERLGEGVMQETVSGLTPSPNLSPKGERNMKRSLREGNAPTQTGAAFQK